MDKERREEITQIRKCLEIVRGFICSVYKREDIAASRNAAQGSLKQIESENACLDLKEAEELLTKCIKLLEDAHER